MENLCFWVYKSTRNASPPVLEPRLMLSRLVVSKVEMGSGFVGNPLKAAQGLSQVDRYLLSPRRIIMALTFTPKSQDPANLASGYLKSTFLNVNGGVDAFKFEYLPNFGGTASAQEILNRQAVITLLEYALNDATVLANLAAMAATGGVTTPASFVSALGARLAA